jgi:hypothetical protein
MTWRTAFTNLAAITVTGVTTCYDLNTLPGSLPAADLPALAPAFPVGANPQDGEGYSTLTYDGSAWRSVLVIDHVLYWQPCWSEMGLNSVMPDLITAVDSYLAAVRADGRLSGALDEELAITRIKPGIMEYGGVRYFGVKFRHQWVRVLS